MINWDDYWCQLHFGERIQLCKHIMHTPTHIPWGSLSQVMSFHWFRWSQLKDWALMSHYHSSLVFEQCVCLNELAMNASCPSVFIISILQKLFLSYPSFHLVAGATVLLEKKWTWPCYWTFCEQAAFVGDIERLLAALGILWTRAPHGHSGPVWRGSSGCICESWVQQVGH